MALIENIQREELNAVELAVAYEELIKLHDITQEQLEVDFQHVGSKYKPIFENISELLSKLKEIDKILASNNSYFEVTWVFQLDKCPENPTNDCWLTIAVTAPSYYESGV